MLVYSRTRVVPAAVNIIVLEKDGAYYYVHRNVYDQAVILSDQYGTNPQLMRDLIGGETKQPACEFYMNNAPEPINILGPFLDLVTKEEIASDLEEISGVLHVMSMCVNFRMLFKVDTRLRQSVRFSISIRNEYEMLWDRFFAESKVFGESGVYQKARSPVKAAEQAEPEDTGDFWSMMNNITLDNDEVEKKMAEIKEQQEKETAPSEDKDDKSGIKVLLNW
jgi:hypothetical protein